MAKAAFRDAKVRGVLDALGEDIAKRLRAERTFEALDEAFFAPEKRKTRPVCPLIAEAQNLELAHKGVVTRLHEGTYGLPVLPVLRA